MEPDAYSRDFAERGSAYDRAMRAHPLARAEEFAQVVRSADLRPGHLVGDVPSGGGYLRAHLPAGVEWLGHEPCASFLGGGHHGSGGLLPFPWPDASLDRLISLAGVHHHADKRPFHGEVARVLRAGGLYVLSDVAEGSAVARFLDEFVGSHNQTGHEGFYLGETLVSELAESGLDPVSDSLREIAWRAPDAESLASFCIGLFSLRDVTPELFLRTAENRLGLARDAGGVVLRWQLRTVVSRRR